MSGCLAYSGGCGCVCDSGWVRFCFGAPVKRRRFSEGAGLVVLLLTLCAGCGSGAG